MKTRIIILLSALVVGLASFLLYKSFGSEMSEMEIKAQFSDLKTDYNRMQVDLEQAIKTAEYKNAEIVAQKKMIDQLMTKNNITEEELREAKKAMEHLSKVVLEDYKVRLKDTENKYQSLLEEKNNWEKEKSNLVEKVNENQEKITQLNEQYSKEKNISRNKDKVISQKNEKILLASRLVLSNFNIAGFRVRNSGKEVQTDRASRIDRIKVNFDIIPNSLTDSGKKIIYTIIYKPNGEIVSFDNKPTGTFLHQGKKMQYSDELDFNYTNGEEKSLEFAWDNEDFERGNYTIEVYEKVNTDAVLIGKTIKALR